MRRGESRALGARAGVHRNGTLTEKGMPFHANPTSTLPATARPKDPSERPSHRSDESPLRDRPWG